LSFDDLLIQQIEDLIIIQISLTPGPIIMIEIHVCFASNHS